MSACPSGADNSAGLKDGAIVEPARVVVQEHARLAVHHLITRDDARHIDPATGLGQATPLRERSCSVKNRGAHDVQQRGT
mmetsp:Transcript_29804/g.44585  ORF Transcript_29804/g.44585 Transcript_29804/m.44585 type:complete len:80 (-) Transcript_29804:179-418(-)